MIARALKPDPGTQAFLDDALLRPEYPFITLLPADNYSIFDPEQLRIWMHRHARYQLITEELINWLKEKVVGRRAIEICAGMGDLGHHLGIKMTDSYVQVRNPLVVAQYKLTGQPTISPPADVKEMGAIAAVLEHEPDVVIGSWVTQLFKKHHEEGVSHASVYGVDEEYLLTQVPCYIHIGATTTHGTKDILKYEHEELHFPWLISRTENQEDNRIYVWEDKD